MAKTPRWISDEVELFKGTSRERSISALQVTVDAGKGMTQVMFRRPGSERKAWITGFSGRKGWSVAYAYSDDALTANAVVRELRRGEAVEAALWHIL